MYREVGTLANQKLGGIIRGEEGGGVIVFYRLHIEHSQPPVLPWIVNSL